MVDDGGEDAAGAETVMSSAAAANPELILIMPSYNESRKE
jgi:hypothetical protein